MTASKHIAKSTLLIFRKHAFALVFWLRFLHELAIVYSFIRSSLQIARGSLTYLS